MPSKPSIGWAAAVAVVVAFLGGRYSTGGRSSVSLETPLGGVASRARCFDTLASSVLGASETPGLHAACLWKDEGGSTAGAVFDNGYNATASGPRAITTDGAFAEAASLVADTGRCFGVDGVEALSYADLVDGLVLCYTGGRFQWPGVRVGYVRPLALPDGVKELQTLSLKPLVFSISGFLAPDECDYIRTEASPHLERSGVSHMDHDVGKPAANWRTSQTHFLSSVVYPRLESIDARVAAATAVPVSHQEHVQVLRYGVGESYDSHHDFFDPRHYRKDKGTSELIDNGKRNRMATVLWYLSDVEEGGETNFPVGKTGEMPRDYTACRGLKVKPAAGKVILFYDMRADGSLDRHSLHGACKVVEGVKWAANKWVWSEPMHFMQT